MSDTINTEESPNENGQDATEPTGVVGDRIFLDNNQAPGLSDKAADTIGLNGIDDKFKEGNSLLDYKKMGFYHAIQYEKDLSSFERLLDVHRNHGQKKVAYLDYMFSMFEISSEERIRNIKKSIADLTLNTEFYRTNREKEFSEELEGLKKEIVEFDIELLKLNKELGNGKKEIIANRIEQSRKEIEAVIKTYEEILSSKKAIAEKEYEEGKAGFTKKIELLGEIRNNYILLLQRVNNKLQEQGSNLVGNQAVKKIFWFAIAGCGITGFFLSNYLQSKDFRFLDPLKFLVSRLLYLGHRLVGSGSIIQKMIISLEVLSVMTGLSIAVAMLLWVFQKVIEKTDPGNQVSSYKLGITLSDLKSLDLETKLRSKSLLTIWLSLYPFILCSSILLLLVSYYSTPDEIERLSTTITGDSVGLTLNLIGIGLVYIYITGIKDKLVDGGKPSVKQIQRYWELGLILLVNIVFMCLYAVSGNGSHFWLFLFLLSISIVSILGGYSLRYKSLFDSVGEYEYKINALTNFINYYSRPRSVAIGVDEMKIFQKQFGSQYQSILELIYSKTDLTHRFISFVWGGKGNTTARDRYLLWNIFRRRTNLEEKERGEALNMSTLEKIYFPEIERPLTYISEKREQNARQVSNLEYDLRELRSGRAEFQVDSRSRKGILNGIITRMEGDKLRAYENYMAMRQALEKEWGLNISMMIEGAELARWYLINKNNGL